MSYLHKIIAIALFIPLISACSSEPLVLKNNIEENTFTLQEEQFIPILELTGTLIAKKESLASAKVGGRILEMHKEAGDKVSKGELIAILSNEESTVNLQTAQIQENNLQAAYISQEKFLDEQINNAKKALEISNANQDAILTNKNDTSDTTKEQKELAKKAINQAKIALENVEKISEQRIESAYASAKSIIRMALINTTNAINFADTLLGVSDAKRGINSSYKSNLGALNASNLSSTEQSLRTVITEKSNLKILYDEKIENNEPSNDQYDEYLQITLSTLDINQIMLKHLFDVINDSISGSNLSEKQIQEWKTAVLIHGQNIEAIILSSSNGQKTGVKGLINSLEEIRTQNDIEKRAAESALLQAEQFLAQVKAVSNQNISGVESQKTISEKQVEQVQTALDSSIAQKESVLKNLQTQIDLIKGNRQLSELSLQNTRIIAPFHGIITEKLKEVGQVIGAGEPVYSVADINSFKIMTDIPDIEIKRVSLNFIAQVIVDGLKDPLKASITKIFPKVDPITRKVQIELNIANAPKETKIGMFGKIYLELPKETSYFVPKSFIHFESKTPYIILKNKKKVEIETGIEKNGNIKIWWDGEIEGKTIIN